MWSAAFDEGIGSIGRIRDVYLKTRLMTSVCVKVLVPVQVPVDHPPQNQKIERMAMGVNTMYFRSGIQVEVEQK